MRMLDKTFSSLDEEYNFEGHAAEIVKCLLKGLPLDTYNHEYIVRITVDKVDERPQEDDDG